MPDFAAYTKVSSKACCVSYSTSSQTYHRYCSNNQCDESCCRNTCTNYIGCKAFWMSSADYPYCRISVTNSCPTDELNGPWTMSSQAYFGKFSTGSWGTGEGCFAKFGMTRNSCII